MNTTLTTGSFVQAGYLRRLLEQVPVALVHVQTIRDSADQLIDLQISFINTQAATFLGSQTPDDLFGKRWSAVLTTDAGTLFYKQCAQVIADKGTIQYQQERTTDDLTSWFDITISPCDDGAILTIKKVSEQERQRNVDAQHQTKSLQSVIDNIQSSIHIIRPVFGPDGQILDFRFTAVNPALASYAGVKPADLVGSTLSEWFPGYREQGLFDLYRHVHLNGEEQRINLNYTKDGFDIWVDAKISKLENEILITHTDYTALKQAQLELERRADRLKFVTDSALTAIGLYSIIRDPDTGEIADLRYELINGRAEQMTRRKAEELIGRTMRQVFPGIEGTGIWAKYKHLAETGEPLRYHNHYNVDGYNLWYEVQGIRQDDLIVLSFLDITELKEAQQFNKKQAEDFRQILDNALTAISHFTAVRDEKGQIINFIYQSFNHTAEVITGYKAEQIIGNRMLDLFPGVQSSGVFDRWVKLVDQGEFGKAERFQDHYQFDGFDFWFDTQAVKWGDGFIQSYIDITPIKHAELKQQKQAELLNAVLDATLTAVACFESVRDEQGRIADFRFVLANQRMSETVGIPTDEIGGKLLCDVSTPLRNSDAFNQYVRVVETGEPASLERPFGDNWYYVSVVKFGDGLVISAIDITENHKYSEQIEAANAELTKSNENLQAFAYVASHDLQEPLRKIESFGDLLKNQYAEHLSEQGLDMINRMQSAAARMAVLIRDLLSYSRITTQKQPFEREDLNKVVADVLSDLETTIQEKQAQVNIAKLPVVLGDVSQLRQLFQNLFSNALKFVKTKGTDQSAAPLINVTCSQVAKRSLPPAVIRSLATADHSRVKESRQYYAIKIADNGIGFDQQYADRIFGAFQRLHGRQQYPGTGIGLAIVKKVAENHGGVVVAEGQLGEGASFTIYLPVPA
jgi:PAS domain S-box-containing protein